MDISYDNICLYNVTADHYVNAQKYQPVQSTDPAKPSFQDILEEIVNEVKPPQQTYSAPSTTLANTTSIPPPMTPSASAPESSGFFDIGRYYTIPESEVVAKIREVRHNINMSDMTAKTDIEKYDWIENRFADAFGKDFMMARNLGLPSSMFYMVGIEFTDTLNRHIDDPAQVNRERLFGDADTEEIQNTIRDKYSETLTNRGLFMMVHEMRNAGVLDSDSLRSIGVEGVNNVIDTLTMLRSYAKVNTQTSSDDPNTLTIEERDKRWMNVLNKPVNTNDLFRLFNAWSQDNRFSMGSDLSSFIRNFLGGVKNDDGLFVVRSQNNVQSGMNNGGPPVYINIIGGNHYGNIYGDVKSDSTINVEYVNNNTASPGSNGTEPEEDWEKMLTMMLRGMDDYDDLIRSRMLMINSQEHKVVEVPGEDGSESDETAAIEGGAGAEENVEIDENAEAEETPNAEEGGSGAEDSAGTDEQSEAA